MIGEIGPVSTADGQVFVFHYIPFFAPVTDQSAFTIVLFDSPTWHFPLSGVALRAIVTLTDTVVVPLAVLIWLPGLSVVVYFRKSPIVGADAVEMLRHVRVSCAGLESPRGFRLLFCAGKRLSRVF